MNLDTTAKVESQIYFKWISRKSWKYQSLDDMRAKCLEEDFFMLNIRKLQQSRQHITAHKTILKSIRSQPKNIFLSFISEDETRERQGA